MTENCKLNLEKHPRKATLRWNPILVAWLIFGYTSGCFGQSEEKNISDESLERRFLFELSYTDTDTFEGIVDVFAPGFTWLVGPDLRVGGVMSYVSFEPSRELQPFNESKTTGLGDSIFFIQYDWGSRLTAKPWIPDNAGANLTILAPTGEPNGVLSSDLWGVGMSISWPLTYEPGWLVNPLVSYSFSFSEGPGAEPFKVFEIAVGLVKVFPSRFWIGYTPVYWLDLDDNSSNYDDFLTIGKMFKNGMGVGLEYGVITRQSRLFAKYDKSFLLNFYYQFGEYGNK